MTPEPLYLGLDLGTGGARALAVSADGHTLATVAQSLDATDSTRDGTRHEQRPAAWWSAACAAIRGALDALPATGGDAAQISALAIDGTSGTLLPVDDAGTPLRWALMYNDPRAAAEAERLNDLGADTCRKLGYRFDASYALAKILWLAEHEPEVFQRTRRFAHQVDYIVGRLTGSWGVTDWCNALKTGYDVVDERWPEWLHELPGVAERLPRVVPPGTVIGHVSRPAAKETGLREGTPVVSGATDGVAAALASGIHRAGDWNITLGTTLVFKGLSRNIISHPQGLIYSHKLTRDVWLPGASSNVGAAWINAWFHANGEGAEQLDHTAAPLLPTPVVAYPLVTRGERFPFVTTHAEGFVEPAAADEAARYAACLQGTAMVARLALEKLEAVCHTANGELHLNGGGSRSAVWMQCFADVTGRTVHISPQSSVHGAAMLAAAGMASGDILGAASTMREADRTFIPDASKRRAYDDHYARFCAELQRRGYLPS